jgi:hypothetical protein
MIVERRFLITAPVLFGASLLWNRTALAAPAALTFEEFTKRAGDYAKQMIADANRNEDEYLFRVASLVAGLKEFPPIEFGPPFKTMRSGMSYRDSGIAVIQWRMEPNTSYPAHNHPGYNGLTVGIRGECRIRNFDVIGAAPAMKSKESFIVKETQDNILRPGVVASIMSTTRDNIHTLEASRDGVTGVDIIAKVGPDQGFSFVDIAGKAKEPQERTYEATWAAQGK